MLIRTRLGLSVDGFIATPDGRPAFLAMPDFAPHSSYGWAGFDHQIDAVVMGRVPLDAGLASGDWPWPGNQIYVLTSRPVPPDVPADVVVASDRPTELLDRLRGGNLAGDAFLIGGQRTLGAFLGLGTGDRLELLQLLVILGDGVPLSPPGTRRWRLRLERRRAFPDGTLHTVYTRENGR
jgi:dihydrofolate reductase